ncbi:hypothetical protein F2Q69_00031754 [Brassica cretica]|uniref:Uncharacterized protein n=1 Tax=Brassica cretica TaxID=69181 RepID=A0A8S9S6H0_BRACR|nr:hypothetical protein F2Q69_00031754 [Brassica cretica]
MSRSRQTEGDGDAFYVGAELLESFEIVFYELGFALGVGEDDVVAEGTYLQLRYRTDLEPKEKEENPRNRKETEHLQIGIQVEKDWALSWSSLVEIKDRHRSAQSLRLIPILHVSWCVSDDKDSLVGI